MAKKQNKNAPEEVKETQTPEVETETQTQNPAAETEQQLAEAQDRYLRLAAEYDNFRKRTVREKEQSYGNGKADAIGKLLPIYDN
ncbi:MAG: nucleotide exchange factor GrpE, partial [Oscillospiraceae bacterium]|nr:nucleotide exchange factor GrpE [Oscillospiraceae bacterium]